MTTENRELLKERVLNFLEQQPGYDADKVEEITIANTNDKWCILYGENMEDGITGSGALPYEAFYDFISKWNELKGFNTRTKKSLN